MADTAADKRAGKDMPVVDDTAPGEGPVIISSTEARASEPVFTTEEALEKDNPPPVDAPRDASRPADGTTDGSRTSGAGDYVALENTGTGEPGEPEWNAAARPGGGGETTYDGRDYAEVADPKDPMERLEKREIELGADMDYGEHRRTYSMFIEATKWGAVVVVAVLIAMAVGFFLSGGFIGGLVVFFGAVLAGFVFMR